MRKVLSLLLCVAMLCSLVVITAQADPATPQMSIADATVVPGGSVTLDINILNNPGTTTIGLDITDDDDLGVTFSVGDNDADSLGLTSEDKTGAATPFWSGTVDVFNTKLGTLTLSIPSEAALGDYSFTIVSRDIVSGGALAAPYAGSTFTVTVTDKVITGVNVAIDSGISVGVHVQAADIEGVSITAVDVEGKEYATVEDYEEDEESGDYIFYVNVNPWAMNKDFKVDFTGAFTFAGEAAIDLTKLPGTAKDIGILSYCNALLAGSPSDELVQLIADLLAFGQAAQTYQKVAVMALPAGLTPTVAAWEDGNGDPCDFGTYCSENYGAENITKGTNSSTVKKFKFDSAKIEFGSKFVVTFTMANNGTTTAFNLARMKVDGTTYELDGQNFTYAFTPTQYAGVEFVLYGSSTTNNTNKCATNNYGPVTYAAYLNDGGEEGSADIIDLLEAYYNYGVSAEAYVGSLGE